MPKGQAPRTRLQSAIEDDALQQFAFLADEKGLTLAPLNRELYWTSIYYLSDRVGIEVQIEMNYESGVIVRMIRTQNRQLLPDWEDFATFERWRSPMRWLLEHVAGVPGAQVQALSPLHAQINPNDLATYNALFAAYVRLMRGAVDLLIAQPDDVLFSPGARGLKS
jgi:hypothetical protein